MGRVRHAFRVKGKGIKQIARELRLSRNTVMSIVRGEETERRYVRRDRVLPPLGAFAAKLNAMLEENASHAARERLTFQRIYEAVRLEDYAGGYDAVRRFGKGHVVYDPWHYVPVLARKPGALRNGAPFKDWELPSSLERVRRKLKGSDDGDRQMMKILSAVLTDGLSAVEAACAESLEAGVASADVILNAPARRQQSQPSAPILTPERLALSIAPIADCARYDSLRGAGDSASRSRPLARSEVAHGAL